MSTSYDDQCAACLRTYTTLRIFPSERHPDQVTELLGIVPSRTWVKGCPSTKVPRQRNGWFLTTRGEVDSRDTRRHIDAILDRLEGQQGVIRQLLEEGAEIDLVCFWHAAGNAEGGPQLGVEQLQRLAALSMKIGWNIYTG